MVSLSSLMLACTVTMETPLGEFYTAEKNYMPHVQRAHTWTNEESEIPPDPVSLAYTVCTYYLVLLFTI